MSQPSSRSSSRRASQHQRPASPSTAAAASSVSESAASPAQSASASEEEEEEEHDDSDLRELPSGAFLTEAALGEEATHDDDSDNDEQQQQQQDSDAEQESSAHSTASEDDDPAANEEHKSSDEPKLPSSSDGQEEKSAQPAAATSQALVVRAPKQNRLTKAGPRKHLFAYSALFGESRSKIAAARSAKLQSVEAAYEAAMAERTLEAKHQSLQAQLAAEEMERERQVKLAVRAEQKRHARLHAAKLRLEAEARAAEQSITKREMEEAAAAARRRQREFERAALEQQRARATDLRTRAMLHTHQDITARWAENEAAALARFAEDREARKSNTARLKKENHVVAASTVNGAGAGGDTASAPAVPAAVGSTAAAWKKQVEKLGLTDPVVIMRALGPREIAQQQQQGVQSKHTQNPPAGASSARSGSGSGAGGRKDKHQQQQQRASGPLQQPHVAPLSTTGVRATLSSGVGGGSGGGVFLLTHSAPPETHGKQLPRISNVIDKFQPISPAAAQSASPNSKQASIIAHKRKQAQQGASNGIISSVSSSASNAAGAAAAATAASVLHPVIGVPLLDAASILCAADSVTAPPIVAELGFWPDAIHCALALEVPEPASKRLEAARALLSMEQEVAWENRAKQDQMLQQVEHDFAALFHIPSVSAATPALPLDAAIEAEADETQDAASDA